MADGKYLPLQVNMATSDEDDEEDGSLPPYDPAPTTQLQMSKTTSLDRIAEAAEHDEESKQSDDNHEEKEHVHISARNPSDDEDDPYYTQYTENDDEEMKQNKSTIGNKLNRNKLTRDNGSYHSVSSMSSVTAANIINGSMTGDRETDTRITLMVPQDSNNQTVTPLTPDAAPKGSSSEKTNEEKMQATMTDLFPSFHQRIASKRHGKLSKLSTVRVVQTNLTEEQCELMETQIDILLEEEIQQKILHDLFEKYPKLTHSFSMVSGVQAQASFVCRMVRKGYILVYNRSYDELYNILTRHSKYAIHKKHMMYCFDIIAKQVLEHMSIKQSIDMTLPTKSRVLWNKSNQILKDILQKAYKVDYVAKKILSEKQLKQNRNRIARSMSPEDIDCVTSIWQQMVEDNKEKVGQLLAAKIQTQEAIVLTFQAHHIDVSKQSAVLVNMLDKAIRELNKTDQLIPFLKAVGRQHAKRDIKPKLLALMKQIILELIRDILSVHFNKKVKASWNRVLTFIVGVMLMEYAKTKRDSEYSTTRSLNDTSSPGGSTRRLALLNNQSYDENDIEFLENELCQTVITNCQISWQQISKEDVINNAIQFFYKDLMNTKREIKALFSQANMAEQTRRLVRAIGSTVALLDDLDTLEPILQELGKRHVYYGVKPEHFKYVKRCWLKMMKQALHLSWNPQMERSWNIAWDFLTYHMKTSLEDALLLYVPPDPLLVNFKVLINHIDRIQLSDLSFFGDIWFAAYTGDNSSQSYAFRINRNNKGNMDGDGILPFGGVRCLNSLQTVDKYRNLKEPYIRYFEEDDTWYLRGNIVGSFSQLFNLHAYPFDAHNIEITFALEVDDTIAKFNPDKISVRFMPFKLDAVAGVNYIVHEPEIMLMEMSAIKGGSSSGRRYTHCKITVPIVRKYIHHVYNIILPLIAIEILAFAIYFTDLYPITQRLILSLTLFLTLFAFRRSVVAGLPATPYLTILDHAFNAACLLSVYHVAGLCAINQFQDFGDRTLQLINWMIAVLGLIIFLVIHIYLYVRARHFISLHPKPKAFRTGNAALRTIAKSALGFDTLKIDTDYGDGDGDGNADDDVGH